MSPIRCSFCGKSKDSVRKFIAGPSVYICDECVALCNEILAADEETQPHECDGLAPQGQCSACVGVVRREYTQQVREIAAILDGQRDDINLLVTRNVNLTAQLKALRGFLPASSPEPASLENSDVSSSPQTPTPETR